jgi:SpoVK/Ycf46/Vps4 family AAA+-type ATPase
MAELDAGQRLRAYAAQRGDYSIYVAESVNLGAMAERTIGFVGADLASLCREAAYCALRRALPGRPEGWEPLAASPPPAVSQADFETALAGIRPSAMREIMVEVPADVSWADIGGLEEVQQLIVENVVYGLSRREAFQAVGIRPAKGMLLYGPPGTGKTLLAKVVARESRANFIAVRGPEVYSKWFGESEERIRQLFAKAREVAPCIIFFDELDAIAPTRGRQANALTDPVVNQLLSETDGLARNDRVFVIGASNRAELIDPALLRPGRFDYQVFVPLPDRQARRAIFTVHLRGNLSPADVPNVKQRLGIGTPLAAASPAEILDLTIGGSLIELDNGWRLTTARIAGDAVLELVLNGVAANRDELIGYGLSEEIVYYKRRWFVVREDALDVLRRLLTYRKPIKDLTNCDGT